MDLLEQGRQLAQKGNYEEALEVLLLALENDKENADIHFYLGLCYSSLQKFSYAKYHYQLVQAFNPNHPKLSLVWSGIKDVEAEKPPERRLTRSAAAKFRREQSEKKNETEKESGESDATPSSRIHSETRSGPYSGKQKSQRTPGEDKWEQAFPTDLLQTESKLSAGSKLLLFLIGIALLGALGFTVLKILKYF